MEVSLDSKLEEVVRREVESGRSASASEFLARAVYHYLIARDLGEDREEESEAKRPRLVRNV